MLLWNMAHIFGRIGYWESWTFRKSLAKKNGHRKSLGIQKFKCCFAFAGQGVLYYLVSFNIFYYTAQLWRSFAFVFPTKCFSKGHCQKQPKFDFVLWENCEFIQHQNKSCFEEYPSGISRNSCENLCELAGNDCVGYQYSDKININEKENQFCSLCLSSLGPTNLTSEPDLAEHYTTYIKDCSCKLALIK